MNEKMTALWKYNFWGDNAFDLGFMRTGYTERIEKLTGNPLVKVLVGQRRAGKSFVLRQLAWRLINSGVPRRNIFMMNREFEDFSFVRTDRDLNDLFRMYLDELKPEGKIYLFLDEVQNIEKWESFVNSYSQDYTRKYELFITGSNSRMLSGELATLLSGRYVEIEVSPFSYDEILGFLKKERGPSSYNEYIHSSGLPVIYSLSDDEMRRDYVQSLKYTVIVKDIVERNKVRDVPLLDALFAYLVNNASNLISVQSAVGYMKSLGRKVSYDTVAMYLGYLEAAFLVFHTKRYSIRGRAVLGGNAKYYANDLAFRNYLYRGFGYGDGYLLENAVYLDLRRHGYDCYTGYEEGGREIDFIGIRGDRKVYIQATYSLADENKARREYAPLEAIRDSFEKYIVSMDDFTLPSNNGIRNIQAWNLSEVLD